MYNSADLIEVLQNAKTKSSTSTSSSSSVDLPSGDSEGMTNPMESSGVDQLLARVLSNTGTVNKTIAPPSANRFMPTPTPIEEVPGVCVCMYVCVFVCVCFCVCVRACVCM